MKIVNENIKNALILLKQKKYLEAKKAFLEIANGINVEPIVYFYLFEIFQSLSQLDEAEKYLKKFIDLDKKNHIAVNNLANLYLKKKDYDKAEKYYLKAIDLKQDYLTAISNIALYYQGIGKITEAKKYYNKAIILSPKNLGIYFNLSKLDKNLIDQKKIKFITKLLEEKNLDEFSYACGYFLLAESNRTKKEYSKEINHLKIAHEYAFKHKKDFNEQSVKYWLNYLPKNYNKFIYKSKENLEKQAKKFNPIFIIGLPRSGSTIIESIISSGDEKVLNLGETNLINWSFINTHGQTLFNKTDTDVTIKLDIFEQKILSVLNTIKDFDTETKFFTEKSLENFFYIDLILEIFPNAKFIHSHRNIEDNVIAIFQKFLTNLSWTHSVENILTYIDHYLKIIEYYKKKYPQKILSISLEEFTEKNEKISKQIYKFCGLDWSEKVLKFNERKDLFSSTASNFQIRNKLQKYDYEKYKPYKVFLKEFSEKFKNIEKK